jgi:hypothetical protein
MRESCAQLPESIGDLLSQSQTLVGYLESLQSLYEDGRIEDWSISRETPQEIGSSSVLISVRLPIKPSNLVVSLTVAPTSCVLL